MLTKEESELESLTRLFDSKGWQIFEDKLSDLLKVRKDMLSAEVVSGNIDVAHTNFEAGKINGLQEALCVALELKEAVEEGKEPAAERA